MENLITFSRGNLIGTIKRKKFEAFAEILPTEVICESVDSKSAIDEFIKRMDLFFYSTEEFDNLYFFYKSKEMFRAVHYNTCWGNTTIKDIEITKDTKLKACNWGYIQVFVPRLRK
jgi:hypothetical protein